MRLPFFDLFFCALLLWAATGARAADVSGQTLRPRGGAAREAVVWLEGSPAAAPLAHAVVDQRDKTFVPHVSVVTLGTTVEFPNSDTVLHNVFAYYNAKKFDLGVYPRGATKRITFDKTGYVALLCNVHSEMSAYIVVVNTPFYAVTDREGRFVIRNVPPGAYTLHVWHESGTGLTQPLAVAAGGPRLTLSLTRQKR